MSPLEYEILGFTRDFISSKRQATTLCDGQVVYTNEWVRVQASPHIYTNSFIIQLGEGEIQISHVSNLRNIASIPLADPNCFEKAYEVVAVRVDGRGCVVQGLIFWILVVVFGWFLSSIILLFR